MSDVRKASKSTLALEPSALVEDISLLEPLLKTYKNFTDIPDHLRGQLTIYSQWQKFALGLCFKKSIADPPEVLEWTTSPTRILYHTSWCRICDLLLPQMLYCKEHDLFETTQK